MQRTPETYEQHLKNVVGCCRKQWLVLHRTDLVGEQYLIAPKTCKSNYCPHCRRERLAELRRMLTYALKKHEWRLVTLTYPQRYLDWTDTIKKVAKDFDRFWKRVRRVYPKALYVRTIELHGSNYPHIHLVVNRYIPQAFLQKHWRDVGGGIVDIRSQRKKQQGNKRMSYKAAARYLTEELEKKQQDPYRLGLAFWMARRRSIASSRQLKLYCPPSPWKLYSIANTIQEAYEQWNWLVWKATHNLGEKAIGIIDIGEQKAIFGVGIAQSEKTKFTPTTHTYLTPARSCANANAHNHQNRNNTAITTR